MCHCIASITSQAIGDGTEAVRAATSKAVGVIMSKLLAHGVKMIHHIS